MTELNLSYIENFEHDNRVLTELVKEFGAQQGVQVHLQGMTWSTAWAELLTIASRGSGPDVSHIGGTWVSSLARMNALRPFKSPEIVEMGIPMPFMVPTWQSTKMFEDERVWSIPWTGWVYFVCYRKDLLREAGIDVPKPFGTPQTFRETLATLKNSSLEIPWLNPLIPQPYTDLLHIAASWIWAADGDFINASGTRVNFDSPQAITGFSNWLDAYRAVPIEYRNLPLADVFNLFMEGRVAAFLCDVHMANDVINRKENTLIQENVEVATIADAPWVGGGNFVIWEHTRGHFDRERAAVQLVNFLTNKESNLRWKHETGNMPARIDALKEIYPAGNPLHDAIMLAAHKGRAYHNIQLWHRIEHQLSQELSAVVNEAYESPSIDSGTILRAHLEPLARRLNVTLEN
jgi:ABC-type glycerol-3-phosphate transport system substrate-binding protein